MENRMRSGSRIPAEVSASFEAEVNMFPPSCNRAKRHWSQHMYEVEVKHNQSLQSLNHPRNQDKLSQNGNISSSPQHHSTAALQQGNDANMNSIFRGTARRWSSGLWIFKDIDEQCPQYRPSNWPLLGGAELGQFCRFSCDKFEEIQCVASRRGRLHKNDVIVEVNDVRVSGFTLYDLKDLLDALCFNNVVIHLKVIRAGFLPLKLGDYMNRKYPSHTVDKELQETIRENIYRRTIPYTTRGLREGELEGVEYRFILVNEFLVLERSGLLMESGLFEDNYYGTPFPESRDSKISSNSEEKILSLLPPSSPISQLVSPWSKNNGNCPVPSSGFGVPMIRPAYIEQFRDRVNNDSIEKNFGSIATISSQPNSSMSSTSDVNLQKSKTKHASKSSSSSSSSGSSSSVLAAGLLSTLLSTITLSSHSSKTSVTSQSSRNDVSDSSCDRRKSMTETMNSDKRRKQSACSMLS